MVLDLRKLQQSLHKYDASVLYALVGSDEYLLNQAKTAIYDKVMSDGLEDFNYTKLCGYDHKGSKVLDCVETLPMMSDRRLVQVDNADSLKESDWKTLNRVLEEPVDSTCLVFVFNKLDKRKKFYKLLQKNGVVVELKTPYDNKIPAWIDYISSQVGLNLNHEAKAILFQLTGNHLIEIKNELEKVKAFLGDGVTSVNKETILQVVSKSKFDNIFELTKAIGEKKRGQALYFLTELINSGNNEISALALIKRHMRILFKIKKALSSGVGHSQLASLVGVPQFFVKEYLSQANLWTDAGVMKTIDNLKQTDMALKSSPVSSHIWLENFIIKSCQEKAM